MLIDTHAHLTSNYYDDLEAIIKKCHEKKVDIIVASCCNTKDLDEYMDIIKHQEIYLTIGIHPEDASIYNDKDIELIRNYQSHPKVLAIGEIGLDYHYDGIDKKAQQELFRKMLNIAQENNKPIVIHSRDAVKDTIDILKEYKLTGIIHCFSGSLETAKEYIKMGYYLGIGGVVTFKNSKLKEVIKEIGLDHIVLETDSPYLSPYRGFKNDPSNVYEVASFLAELLNMDINEVAKITTNNAKRIYNL